MNHRTSIPLTALVAGTFLVSTPAASAAPASNVPTDTNADDAKEICLTEASEQTVALSENTNADELIDQVMTSIDEGDFTLNSSTEDLLMEDAEATTIEIDGQEFSSVTVPVGGNYGMASNFTVVFDGDGEVTEYAESLHSENNEGNVTVESYNNGELTSSEDVDISYMTREELQNEAQNVESADEVVTQSDGTVGCVAATLGIGTVAAGTIVALCAPSCAVPVTPPTAKVCAACIGGIVTIAGSTTAFTVMGCF